MVVNNMYNQTSLAYLALPRHLALMAGLALFSAIIVRAMIAVGVPDIPDFHLPQARKIHVQVTPKSGGVGIVAAFLLGVFLLYRYGHVSRLGEPHFLGLIAAAMLMAIVAFIDDLFDLSFIIKLITQLAAACVVVSTGFWVHAVNLPFFGGVDLGPLGIGLTLLFIIFITNSMNFIDGLNGLAAGVALISCLFLAGISAASQNFFVYTAALLLAGGLVGFLPYNFPQARIFMGDVGSQFCGFMLALFGIAAARYGSQPLSFMLVPLLLSGVLFDVGYTLLRRSLAGENIAQAHRGHLYQLAQLAGMNAKSVTWLHWGFACLGGLAGIAFFHSGNTGKLLLVLALLGVQLAWVVYVSLMTRQLPEHGGSSAGGTEIGKQGDLI